MTSAILNEHAWTVVEEEIVAVWVAGVDTEVPVAGIPVERTVEIGRGNVCAVLPVEQYVAQVEVALTPVVTIEVVVGIDTHEVVEVYLVGSLILCIAEIKFIRHLVGEEQSLLACLFVAHGFCRNCHYKQ